MILPILFYLHTTVIRNTLEIFTSLIFFIVK